MRRTQAIVIVSLMLITLILAACGGGQASPTDEEATQVPTAAETHVEEKEHTDDEAVAEGLVLFRSLGCAGCHGLDGEGGTGPALAGHTAEQLRRQVRTPKGDVMPPFSQEQLGDAQLQLIIVWVESLGPATGTHGHDEGAGDEHVETEGFQTVAPPAAHVRLALFAVKDGNAHDTEHHLEDLISLLDDEHTKEQVETLLSSIQSGVDLHDMEHEMEHLMGELDPEAGEANGPNFHLQLVLDSLTLDDVEAAGHHLAHYVELVDEDELAEKVRELQTHLEEGELHTVEEGVQALLTGREPDHKD